MVRYDYRSAYPEYAEEELRRVRGAARFLRLYRTLAELEGSDVDGVDGTIGAVGTWSGYAFYRLADGKWNIVRDGSAQAGSR